MLRRSKLVVVFYLSLIYSFSNGQSKSHSFISLDTTCVFNTDVETRDLNKWYLSPDLSEAKLILGPLQINYVDSNTFFNFQSIDLFSFDTAACKELKFNSDSCIVIENENYKWTFISDVNDSIDEVQLIGFENRKFYKQYGFIPTYLGYIPSYNLAAINLVDVNGAYAVTNLIDLGSGKMIHDLSEYDNGTLDYLATGDLILSYSSSIFDSDECEIHFIKIQQKGSFQYCLNLIGTLVISDYSINEIKWFNDKVCCIQLTKSDAINQNLYLKIAIE